MNKIYKTMKRIQLLLLLMATLFPSVLISQNSKSKKEIKKEMQAERKAQQAHLDSINREMALLAVEANSWVLNATSINVTGGTVTYVQPNVNFIKVVGETMTFQTSTGFGGGINAMGGVTLNGMIVSKTSSNDKGSISYTYKVRGTALNAMVILTFDNEGDTATAFMNFDNGYSLTMSGEVQSYTQAAVSEGSALN